MFHSQSLVGLFGSCWLSAGMRINTDKCDAETGLHTKALLLCYFATHPLQSVDTTGADVQTRDYHTQEYKNKRNQRGGFREK